MGCHWTCNDQEGFVSQLPAYAYQLNLAKAKEWLTDNSFRKLNGFFKDHRDQDDQPHEKFFMRALASHGQTDGLRPLPENSSFDGYEGDHVGESLRSSEDAIAGQRSNRSEEMQQQLGAQIMSSSTRKPSVPAAALALPALPS
ncbi:hypothetical protein GW17_00042916, partial [Ensete ventricosum]